MKAIKNKKCFVIIPWQMNIIGIIMKFLPIFLWDYLAKQGPKKLRKKLNN